MWSCQQVCVMLILIYHVSAPLFQSWRTLCGSLRKGNWICCNTVMFLNSLHSLHHKSESWDDHIRTFLRCTIRHYCNFWCEYELYLKHNISAGVLKIITEMFLPHIGLSELEDECLSKILPKVNMMNSYFLLGPVLGISSPAFTK